MNIFYIIGVILVVFAVLAFFGFRYRTHHAEFC